MSRLPALVHLHQGLALRGLSCARGERALFSGVSAVVRPGQLLRVQGANGAGKTTLLRTICGLARADAGEVLWRGRPIADDREAFHRELVYMGHAAALKDNLCAVENLMAACALAGLPCAMEAAAHALAQTGLAGVEWLPVRMLSQGQRRRVALARLAVPVLGDGDAALWVLDEPFNALDEAAGQWLVATIEQHLARGGIVVLTSHQAVRFGDGVSQVVIDL
ncbi:cytochrome c biogenesis heme-transporting ATPase CcmA [soil metagenome]